MKTNQSIRIRMISIFVLFFALLIIGKLYDLQIVDHDIYTDKADRQYTARSTGIFNRGSIYFQYKDGSLVSGATLQNGFTIAILPNQIKDAEEVYTKLSEVIPLDRAVFFEKANKVKDPYEEIVNNVSPEVGQRIIDLQLPGLKAYKERWRFYPGQERAAKVLGILGYKGDEYAGRYGLERQYEKTLTRTDSSYTNFFAEIFSNLKKISGDNQTLEGDIVTTIEPTVQAYLENVIASTTEKWQSKMTGAIILNPKTGEIYAMETFPTFNPNHIDKVADISLLSNPLVENVYEMGSVIKPLALAAGLDKGVITATSTYDDKGFVMVNGKKIGNFDGKARGLVTMQDVISQSLNTGMAHIVSLLGNDTFTNYMYQFGLNEKTNVDLPNEGKNLVKNLESPRDIEHVTASFGQGIALSPVSTVAALATLANNGKRVYPHVVKRIEYKIGVTKDVSVPLGAQVIKPETAQEVSRMLTWSTDHTLANGTLSLPNYSVAVKTGTAQISKQGGGGYRDDAFLHSFIGYFPSYNPRFFIFMYTLEPVGVRYGSETLAQPFMDMVQFLINYYEVPPDR